MICSVATKPIVQVIFTAQKMKFSSKGFFSKCDQIRSYLRIWSHLLKKSIMENFIFCAMLLLNTPDNSNYCLDKT